MGNLLGSGISYPAVYNSVIAVGASTKANTRALYSNYGSHIEFLAPGGSGQGYPDDQNILTTSVNDYTYVWGTSFATPVVAGCAGLLLAKRSDLYNDDIKNLLIISCDKVPEMQGVNFTQYHGYGRINIKKALDFLQSPYVLTNNLSTTGGTDVSTGDLEKVFITGVSGLGTGSYWVKKHEIRKTVNFPEMTDVYVWGRGVASNGWSLERPIFGQKYCEVVPGSVTTTSAILRTYIYEVWTLSWTYKGYYPTTTNNVTFAYTVLGKPIVAPIISHFTQNPDPICKGTTGWVTAHLSQGNPNQCTWTWEAIDKPAGVVVTGQGQYCSIYYPYSSAALNPMAPIFQLKCTASISGFPSSTRYYTPRGNADCSGCPTLAFNVGGEMTDDNPLLITSLSNPGTDVTDYYIIQNSLTPVGNQINLRIHEPQTEHTWLDYAELIVTRVKRDELVAVNDDGEIINYKESTAPVTVMLNGETDITEILASMDSIDISLVEGDVLSVIRNSQSPEDDGDGDIVLGGEIPIKDQESITLRVTKQNGVDESIESRNGDDPLIGGLFFRPKRSVIAKSLRNVPPGNLEIEINKDLVLDYLAVVRNIRTARTRTLNLLGADHSQQGDVKNLLSSIDQNYAEILPGESIDFNFQFDNVPAERIAYIIKAVGRYETDTTSAFNKLAGTGDEELIPIENKLFDNYPNPFNPTTQIKYSVKENGVVTLKVYDVLGKEVAGLVNEEKQSGTYTVTFDAGSLSSGIYFYTITAKNFHQTKKMLLIK